MNTDYTNLKIKGNNEVSLKPAFISHLVEGRNEKLYSSSTVHVNPLCVTNKILVNKEKFNKGTRNVAQLKSMPISEKIYYNPKFLTKHVKTSASIYVKPYDEQQISQNDTFKLSDTTIHINRNYLVPMGDSHLPDSYLQTKKMSLGGIHINPKFFEKQKQQENIETNELSKISTPIQKSKFENVPLLKNKDVKSTTVNNIYSNNIKLGIQTNSKYKLVKSPINSTKTENNSKPLCIKSKYSLKMLTTAGKGNKIVNKESELAKSLSIIGGKNKLKAGLISEFKKFSRTKLVRKTVLKSIILARRRSRNNLLKKTYSPVFLYKKVAAKKKSTNLTYFPKENNQSFKKNNIENFNSFKRLSKMKIVRKSLLKTQIESRNRVRKQHLRDQIILLKDRNKFYNSKFNSVRNDASRKKCPAKDDPLKWGNKNEGIDTLRIKCKKLHNMVLPSKKHLRKNNQPCPFYNRFGRCKGKDKGTCPKIHDEKYISICRKLLQGECTAKDCLLSHDIRPGKMPTCHHYLAGLCTRPNCPFLHIKVNPKAPICMAFLQGFCPDVYNCLKRHEFICPIYAEKGNCPRGKSCTNPHRSPVVHSKLLKDDQKPLIHRITVDNNDQSLNKTKIETNEVSSTINSQQNSSEDFNDDDDNLGEKILIENLTENCIEKDFVKESFTRYFAIPPNYHTEDKSYDNKNVSELEDKIGNEKIIVEEFR